MREAREGAWRPCFLSLSGLFMNTFPAVLVGGPPHSGKSVLAYLLTQCLRKQQVEHYVLRACPDGEGDWSQEAPPTTVRLLRQKGAFSADFVDRVCRDLERRHLPLIVDAGGRPTLDQERIFDFCTHAVLISSTLEGLAEWRDRAQRHGLAIVAELLSTLSGADRIDEEAPVLRGQIAGLERYAPVAGPVTAKLAERLARILGFAPDELQEYHLRHAPTELAIDAVRLFQAADPSATGPNFQPTDLPRILASAPRAPLSLYGRGPNWLYVALALHVTPHRFYLFDPRLGWTQPSLLTCAAAPTPALFTWRIREAPACTWIEVQPRASYLDYDEAQGSALPALDPQRGVVISGKLPHWLLAGIALAYRQHPWLAVVQAQRYNCGIVVMSRSPDYQPGHEVVV